MTTNVAAQAGGITQIDTMTAGLEQVCAGYLINAARPALIECGPALSIDSVISALRALGMDPDDLAYLVCSHIHLDHAGGAGDIARAFPKATVVVSEVGARHLVTPERLNASSREVYGELMDTVYGDCTPIPEERVRGVGDNDAVHLGGGRQLDILYTPGHAKHHIGIFDSDSGALFVGDSVGVRTPRMVTVRPATPPADFDFVLADRSLQRYRSLEPASVYLAHFGAAEPPLEALDDAADQLRRWVETADTAYAEHSELDHVVATLERAFPDAVNEPDNDEGRRRADIMNGYRTNALGLIRYFQQRAEGKTAS